MSESETDYARGMKCELFGKQVGDMTRDELISAIGQLDMRITELGYELQDARE